MNFHHHIEAKRSTKNKPVVDHSVKFCKCVMTEIKSFYQDTV